MNTVKITSGIYRGRKIATPGGGTHPMGERERIALFNMLGDRISGAEVLDAYCGGGTLGIEAISRGAKEVVLIEKSHTAMRIARDNCRELGIPEEKTLFYRGAVDAFYEKFVVGTTEVAGAVTSGDTPLQTFPKEVDIMLADPPYDKFRATEVGRLAVGYLAKEGILVLSHPEKAPEIEGMRLLKTHKYAAAHLSVYALA